ncbi:branched-chain amino acid ABC transporter ATP-binding protein/permease [Methylobacterium terricola]|uniref:Branched-chain amino acid ABC transporter ATP-binding protein/permease n=1 Tax=Methylobacterium terricola TaxID=2583531 RepID=A0A5C4LPU3_9HYPH|nr:branched-chain amino acid ABC transporter ATP-binding protein/permease [Methylobacterium terricola]TNC15836.1 branched-chain amino acid ABC transporter ATP-binding protein/permease [Methylobacterium terricola]
MSIPSVLAAADAPVRTGPGARLAAAAPFLLILGLALAVPLAGNDYWTLIATRAAIYWILVSGLNLVVGFAGQLAIGYVALLLVGAYTTSVLAAGTVLPALPAFAALACAGIVGALVGVVVGLPALRLRTFYFAMTTLGFATIVTQIALAWQDVTGGGIGITGPEMPSPFDSRLGFYGLCLAGAVLCTWMTLNVAGSRWGRALVAIRDAEVAAEAVGIAKPRLLVAVFLFAGGVAAVAGGLFASLQTYITPDAFTFDLSLLFFIAVLIGGRGSVLGPLIGTILLTLLPEVAAPLAAWSTFLYAFLLLVIVLVLPGGIADLLDRGKHRPLPLERSIAPRAAALQDLAARTTAREPITLTGVRLSFGAVRAIDGLDLTLRPGGVHGLIGPNGSGKTTTLNVISGYYRPQEGRVSLGTRSLLAEAREARALLRIARTFQTPRIVGDATVIENVMLGGSVEGRATLAEALLALPRHREDERALRASARLALRAVGLDGLDEVRAGRLQHSELRFLEIARALMLRPAFLLLDEPAAGLSAQEIQRLGGLIRAVADAGIGVLLVEHHADLIFAICDEVTVLNLGRVLAAGTPSEIRSHREVVSAYLGG